MTTTVPFVTDSSRFETLRRIVDRAFRLSAKLPEQVFAIGARYYGFCEFEELMGANFWSDAASLARQNGDTETVLCTVEPNAQS